LLLAIGGHRLRIELLTGCFRPFDVIGKKWKLPFAGWSRNARTAWHWSDSGFLP
jgi:hypothetical protein